MNQSFELKTQFNSGLVTWYLSDGESEATPMLTNSYIEVFPILAQKIMIYFALKNIQQ